MNASLRKTTGQSILALVTSLTIAAIAVDAALGNVREKSPPPAAIQAQSQNWAAKGQLLNVDGRTLRVQNVPPPTAIQAQSRNWAAKARLLNVDGTLRGTEISSPDTSGSFDWGDFGVGVGAVLGLVVLASAFLLGTHVIHVREKAIS